MTIKEARSRGKEILSTADIKKRSSSIQLDVDVFLQEILCKDKSYILFHGDEILSQEQEISFKKFLEQRLTGLPVAYITGKKEFFGYTFHVTPDVLIPKPDTELLVEKAVEYFEDTVSEKTPPLYICDMCTGSGCVGISFLKYIQEKHICSEDQLPYLVFADISQKALTVAEQNARTLLSKKAQERIKFIRSNLFSEVTGKFNMILTNPPYIPALMTQELLLDGRSEPALALDGDVDLEGNYSGTDDGLAVMKNLIPQAYDKLYHGGILIAEAGEYNAEKTESFFKISGFTDTKIHRDLEGQLRDIQGLKR